MLLKQKMLFSIRPNLIFTNPVGIERRLISLYGAANYRNSSSHHSSQSSSSKDYYKVLGIKRNSNRKEIKLAYYKLSKQYHPDVSEIANSEEKYKDIQEAYHVLGDERRKADYDEDMRGGYYAGPSSSSAEAAGRAYRYGSGGVKSPYKRSGPVYSGEAFLLFYR